MAEEQPVCRKPKTVRRALRCAAHPPAYAAHPPGAHLAASRNREIDPLPAVPAAATGAAAPLDTRHLCSSPPGRAPALCRQLVSSIDKKATTPALDCQAFLAFQAAGLLQTPEDNYAWLTEAGWETALPAAKQAEGARLQAIYQQVLLPLIQRHFLLEQQRALKQSLQYLILLRLLELPYHAGCPLTHTPSSAALLETLQHLCHNYGLMLWQEGAQRIFVVETQPEACVAWIHQRMCALVDYAARDKALSDALWTLFFAPQIADALPIAPLPGREGLLVYRRNGAAQVIVFESIWEPDRGRRLQGILRAAPYPAASRPWVWEPRAAQPEERATLWDYSAAATGVRYAGRWGPPDTAPAWLSLAMRQHYLQITPQAVRVLHGCYREGWLIQERVARALRAATLPAALHSVLD